ncbi:DNA-binding protein [Actinocorallia populi]|uniref:DNA-binding protein n=1 Tax=Actinocorallia populi TaxID=2079200 RepID=UPI000D091EA8|nr:DNA-binding protein [Actinocorallia populi]
MGDASGLLAAGAVLPLGTEGAGEQAVPLAARKYRHQVLGDRVVVRLVAVELGAGEDRAAEFLGMERLGEPREVGLGRRGSLGFPEWVLVHHPEDGHHALDVVPELERIAQRAKTKPKAALDAFRELGGRLESSVPHLLPTFYERVAREFLAIENTVYAVQMFARARAAEAEHGLPIDEERLDAVFLEFMLAGALPVKVISGYAKGLAARVPADEALRRFTRLCLRRTAGGMAPSSQVAADLRRLAKAAGENVRAVEHAYLTGLLAFPVTEQAALGWWKAHRSALSSLAERQPEVLGTLLNMMPSPEDRNMPELWLQILEAAGAFTVLCDPDGAPEEARPKDGSAGWLQRFLDFWNTRWRRDRPPALLPLVERMADRLRSELAASGASFEVPHLLDLLDLMLALDVPVTGPGWDTRQPLTDWARGEDRRDLLALAADPRFRHDFHRNADRLPDDEAGRHALRVLLASPGGRPLLAGWVAELARRTTAAALPDAPGVVEHLGRLPGEVLAQAGDAVRAAVTTGMAPALRQTLRAGILDELGWSAWEEALADLARPEAVAEIRVAGAWPHLIVAGRTQARVIGAEGTVLTHDLRVLDGDVRGGPGFHHVDGELLVHWKSWQRDGGLLGYRHTDADRHHPVEGHFSPATPMSLYKETDEVGLSLPGGGLATGAGTLRREDTVLPESRQLVTDGTSYWVWTAKAEAGTGWAWHEYDPVNGERGRESTPGFFADATRDLPGGVFSAGWLLPAPGIGDTPVGTPSNGLLGWRVVWLPDESYRGEDLAGNTVTAPKGHRPLSALFLPGDDRPRAVASRGYQRLGLVDPDGAVTSSMRTDGAPGAFAEGTVLLPPVRYWHCLSPRDPRGSAALRRIDLETATSLLKAAMGDGDLIQAVRELLPDLTHEALIAGVAGVARHAAARQKSLDETAKRLEEARAEEPVPEEKSAPGERLVREALSGLDGERYQPAYGEASEFFAGTRIMLQAAAGKIEVPAPEGRPVLHLDGPDLPGSRLWERSLPEGRAAMAYRAVSEITDPEHREALRALLKLLDKLDLVPDENGKVSRWRLFNLYLDATALRPALQETKGPWSWNGLLPLDGGAFLTVVGSARSSDYTGRFTTMFYDPSCRFEVPDPYTVLSSEPFVPPANTIPLDGFLAAAAERGPVPWSPEAAAEFSRLTGVTEATARLVVAGLPWVDKKERNFLPSKMRTALGLKAADAAVAREELRALTPSVRRALVGALLPADPARLWTDGPDVAAAAKVWNTEVGKRLTVPVALMTEACQAVRTRWEGARCLSAVLDPASEPRLSRDVKWIVRGDHVSTENEKTVGFTQDTLFGAVAMTAWLAHRLPAGDPLRERLPETLETVRARLAYPDLMFDFGNRVELDGFRRVAGPPTEAGDGYERYGAVVMATGRTYSYPGVRPALLDEPGSDSYLTLLQEERPDFLGLAALGPAVRTARDERFAALLADPGDPVAGERDADGMWWPQDPSRSVPDLVAEAASRYGLGSDAAAVYLMLLAMPDPTDKNTARWTGWQPDRLKAACAELAERDLVVEARRSRAGRSLFLPGGWIGFPAPRTPLEEWKLPLYPLAGAPEAKTPFGVVVPAEPVADLYRKAWRRVREEDGPRFAELQVRRGRGR